MKHPKIEPGTPILIAETQSTARKLMSDVFKELGYENVLSVDNLKTVLTYLEKNQSPWVITSLHMEEEVNALQLLTLIGAEPRLRRTFVSLLVEEADTDFTLQSFALGAVSWHAKDLRMDTMQGAFKEFLTLWNMVGANSLSVSVNYLQSFLRKLGKNDLRSNLLARLVEQYPQREEWILELANAQFEAAKPDDGLKTVARAKAMGLTGWEPLAEKHLSAGDSLEWKMPLRRVLIVDKDEASVTHLQTMLENVCDCEVVKCDTAENALQELQNSSEIDCIFMEWSLKNFTGPQFLQRIRNINPHKLTPLIVTSSLLQRQDMALLTEMGVSGLLEKPVQTSDFSKCFFNTVAESRNPTKFRAIEIEMLRCFQEGDLSGAEALALKFWSEGEGNESQCNYISALFAFHTGQYAQAASKARESFSKGSEPLRSINLLGQCCLRLGDFIGAVKCLKKAQEYSPKNIERLCNLSKAMDELGDEKGAEAALGEAKKVDAASDNVVALEATNALEDGDVETARELMRHAGNLGNLVSDLNNTGIAYTRSGEPDDGIRFYEKTLDAIPPENAEWLLKVTYNLALAYARQDKIEAAHDLLSRSQLNDAISVSGKMRSLMQRLKRSLDTGAQFVIQPSARPEGDASLLLTSSGESPWEAAIDGFENVDNYIPKGKIRAGEYGCAKLFTTPPEVLEKCESYLVEMPAFRVATNSENKDLPEVS